MAEGPVPEVVQQRGDEKELGVAIFDIRSEAIVGREMSEEEEREPIDSE